MMVVEIVGGYMFNSMVLLAEGWHMSSHALALGLSVLAYIFARRFANDSRFAFGTWKIEVLAGYTDVLLLVLVAGLMLFQSAEWLLSPSPFHFDQAIAITFVGLLVNLACAWFLKDGHGHSHHHGDDEHRHPHQVLNLRSSYIHVIADGATSVLTIVTLTASKLWVPPGWPRSWDLSARDSLRFEHATARTVAPYRHLRLSVTHMLRQPMW